MPKSIGILDGKVYKEGIFDLTQFYADLKNWYKEHNFKYFNENDRTTKNKPDGIEIIYKADATREIDDYFAIKMQVDFLMTNGIPVKREGVYQGEIDVKVNSFLILDHLGKWDATAFTRFLHKFYIKYVIKKKNRDTINADTTVYEFISLTGEIKKSLGVEY